MFDLGRITFWSFILLGAIGGAFSAPGDYLHPLEEEVRNKVRKNLGEFFINPKNKSINLEAKSRDQRPWAGYWYPVNDVDMLIADKGPLDRLDKSLRKKRRPHGVVNFENQYFNGIQLDQWEGLCHAWAIASAVFPEPKRDIKVRGVFFNVLDQKAILTKLAEQVDYELYGVRYKGDWETDGTYQDIRPDHVHQILTHYLSRGQNLLIDTSADNETWTKPVFGFKAQIKEDHEFPNALLVTGFIGVTLHRTDLPDSYRKNFRLSDEESDQAFTNNKDFSWMRYEYRLFLGSKRNSRGERNVISGEWINRSKRSHPDVLMVPKVGEPKSSNEVINKNIDVMSQWFIQN